MKNKHWVYILECSNGHYYTGYTSDIVKRYRQHLEGKIGAKYTRSFKPVKIAGCWQFRGDKGTALKIEYLIKSRDRRGKESILCNPEILKDIVKENLNISSGLSNHDPSPFEEEAKKGLLQKV